MNGESEKGFKRLNMDIRSTIAVFMFPCHSVGMVYMALLSGVTMSMVSSMDCAGEMDCRLISLVAGVAVRRAEVMRLGLSLTQSLPLK